MFKTKRGTQVSAAASIALTWIAIGTVVFHGLEPWTWIQALYFSVATLTTVGYGDLHPTSDVTRLVDVFYILFGVASVISAFSLLGSSRLQKKASRIGTRKKR